MYSNVNCYVFSGLFFCNRGLVFATMFCTLDFYISNFASLVTHNNMERIQHGKHLQIKDSLVLWSFWHWNKRKKREMWYSAHYSAQHRQQPQFGIRMRCVKQILWHRWKCSIILPDGDEEGTMVFCVIICNHFVTSFALVIIILFPGLIHCNFPSLWFRFSIDKLNLRKQNTGMLFMENIKGS